MSNPTIGVVGPLSNNVAGIQQIADVPYDEEDLAAIQDYAAIVAANHRREGYYCVRVIGFCMAIRRSVLEQIGGLDTRFGIGNLEDDDLCMRARKARFDIRVAADIFIHHYGSKSFKAARIDYEALMAHNLALFHEKWRVPA